MVDKATAARPPPIYGESVNHNVQCIYDEARTTLSRKMGRLSLTILPDVRIGLTCGSTDIRRFLEEEPASNQYRETSNERHSPQAPNAGLSALTRVLERRVKTRQMYVTDALPRFAFSFSRGSSEDAARTRRCRSSNPISPRVKLMNTFNEILGNTSPSWLALQKRHQPKLMQH